MRRRFLALAAVLAILAGCSSASRHTASSSTSAHGQTDAAPNPDVIPPVITPAYVNAVFAVLNHVDGNATRELVADRAVTPTVTRDLRAIYNDPLFATEERIASQTLKGGFGGIKDPPGDVVTTVVQLIDASASCIFIATRSDFESVSVNPGAPAASEYWSLKPKQATNDPGHLNPTPWALSFNADYLTPTTIPNQCSGG